MKEGDADCSQLLPWEFSEERRLHSSSSRVSYIHDVAETDTDLTSSGPSNGDGNCAELPDEPICPILYQWILEARTGHEVCEAYRAHEIECPVCRPAMKRAA
jgi:hypothetical protein